VHLTPLNWKSYPTPPFYLPPTPHPVTYPPPLPYPPYHAPCPIPPPPSNHQSKVVLTGG